MGKASWTPRSLDLRRSQQGVMLASPSSALHGTDNLRVENWGPWCMEVGETH